MPRSSSCKREEAVANQLKMAKVQTILTLRAHGWSVRRISRELGVHRETAARYARLAEAPPEVDSGDGSDQNRPNLPAGSGPRSLAEPFREFIIKGLDGGLSCQRIWQDLKTEHAFEGSYDSIKRFARRLRTDGALPFRRVECAAGEEAQVDYGTTALPTKPYTPRHKG